MAIGEDANKAVLAEFTGNKEAVLTVHTPEALTKMIRFVSVTASQIGSKSSGVGKGSVDEAANKQDEMIDKINAVSYTHLKPIYENRSYKYKYYICSNRSCRLESSYDKIKFGRMLATKKDAIWLVSGQ